MQPTTARVSLAALMTLLAGCGGGTDGDATTVADASTDAVDAAATATDGGSTDQSNNGDIKQASSPFNGTWDQRYRTGQYYRYDIKGRSTDNTAIYEWEVVSAAGDEATVWTKLVMPNGTTE